ncbi:MAG TPA: DUF5615 family PIN-like protein [Candidatus Solibacter sp.]|nr:DUF5615 family PIN-like protein [Candidatus Solibacter sp.]
MKLLFDEMLSPSLVHRLRDLLQGAEPVRNLSLKHATDTDVWDQAKDLGYVIVTKDKDFANLSLVRGAPPKVIFLQLENCRVQQMEGRLRHDAVRISEFVNNSPKGLLVITR